MSVALMRLAIGALLVYFTFHAVAGEQGLFNWIRVQGQEAGLRARIDALRQEKAEVEERLVRLRPDSLDLDYIDQLARARLAVARPGERILHEEDMSSARTRMD